MSTGLDVETIAQIAEQAAKEAETLQVMIRLENSTPERLVYSARNRISGGRVELMTFEVALKEDYGIRTVRTRILRYRQKRQWVLVVPLPWQMLAWSNYRGYMHALATNIKAEDSSAETSVVELVQT